MGSRGVRGSKGVRESEGLMGSKGVAVPSVRGRGVSASKLINKHQIISPGSPTLLEAENGVVLHLKRAHHFFAAVFGCPKVNLQETAFFSQTICQGKSSTTS